MAAIIPFLICVQNRKTSGCFLDFHTVKCPFKINYTLVPWPFLCDFKIQMQKECRRQMNWSVPVQFQHYSSPFVRMTALVFPSQRSLLDIKKNCHNSNIIFDSGVKCPHRESATLHQSHLVFFLVFFVQSARLQRFSWDKFEWLKVLQSPPGAGSGSWGLTSSDILNLFYASQTRVFQCIKKSTFSRLFDFF